MCWERDAAAWWEPAAKHAHNCTDIVIGVDANKRTGNARQKQPRRDFDRRKLSKKLSSKSAASFVMTSSCRFRTDAHNGSPGIASR